MPGPADRRPGQRARTAPPAPARGAQLAVLALAAVAIATAALAACRDQRPVVARLVEHRGQVDQAPASGDWRPVTPEQALYCEERLRTAAQAEAEIELSQGGRLTLAAETVIRLTCQPGQAAFDLTIGEATIEASEGGASTWILDIGTARLEPGAVLAVRADRDNAYYEVIVGSATIERADAADEPLTPGTVLEVSIGTATVRRIDPNADADADPDTDPNADAAADAEPAAVDRPAPTPASADDNTGERFQARLRGRRNRVRRPGERRWRPIPAGEHELAPGTEVKLGRSGEIELTGGTGKVRWRAPGELLIGPPGPALATLRRGAGTLEANAGDANDGAGDAGDAGGEAIVEVPGGTVSTRAGQPNTRARLAVGRSSTDINGRLGTVDVASKTGAREALGVGERASLSHRGQLELERRTPAYAEVIMTAGESVTIHDPRPPTAVGVRLGDTCSGDSVVELSPNRRFRGEVRRSQGRKQANLRIDRRPALHHYRVRCLDGGALAKRAHQTGTIRIARDAATRRLPRGTSQNTVVADGRKYTVRYQNRLPDITLAWPRTADPGPYTLTVTPERGPAERFESPEPRYQLRSGALAEGVYRYQFAGRQLRSKESTLRIEFDNAAPSVSLQRPPVKGRWSGDKLDVAGVAVPGSRVSVGGRAVALDRQGRFDTAVPLPIPNNVVSIRVTHPRYGVHYYVRRGQR